VDVVSFDNYVANVDADSKQHFFVIGFTALTYRNTILDIRRTLNSIHDTAKLHQEAISHRLEEPPSVFLNGGIYYFIDLFVKPNACSSLIRVHEPTVSDYIRRQYGRQSPLDTLFCHDAPQSRFIGEILFAHRRGVHLSQMTGLGQRTKPLSR
jgi:hypothetical protein